MAAWSTPPPGDPGPGIPPAKSNQFVLTLTEASVCGSETYLRHLEILLRFAAEAHVKSMNENNFAAWLLNATKVDDLQDVISLMTEALVKFFNEQITPAKQQWMNDFVSGSLYNFQAEYELCLEENLLRQKPDRRTVRMLRSRKRAVRKR